MRERGGEAGEDHRSFLRLPHPQPTNQLPSEGSSIKNHQIMGFQPRTSAGRWILEDSKDAGDRNLKLWGRRWAFEKPAHVYARREFGSLWVNDQEQEP
jgi:hypothetical protein